MKNSCAGKERTHPVNRATTTLARTETTRFGKDQALQRRRRNPFSQPTCSSVLCSVTKRCRNAVTDMPTGPKSYRCKSWLSVIRRAQLTRSVAHEVSIAEAGLQAR